MRRQFLRFALVGTVGFMVDVGVLYLALGAGCGYYLGRAISFLAAAFTTWQLNRRYTFSVLGDVHWSLEWLRYLAAMLGGGMVNYGCYAALVYGLPKTSYLPALAVAAGSIAGLAVNFLAAKLWVFRQQRESS